MLRLRELSLRRGTRLLFSGVDVALHPGWKVGLTGANGSGKSSLLALLRGELTPDRGELVLPPGLTIAHLAQESPALGIAAVDYVMQGDVRTWPLLAALREAEAVGDGERQARLHAQLEAAGGYAAPARAARILDGLGFGAGQQDQPLRAFSGGWRVRLALARTLMCRSDLMLLDEPTNHLDLDAVLWLEEWLRGYAGTLLLIAHDREFLDRVVDHVLHIEGGGIGLYNGNYSDFERRRAQRLAEQQAAYAKQQREIAHIRRFVDRFRAKASKARQAQSRLKALAAMERIAPAHVDSPFHFAFRRPGKLPRPLLRLEDAAAGYGGRAVIEGVRLGLAPGERIALLGANGAGKSTLLRVLAGARPLLAGRREAAPDLRIGYFAQHQLEQLRGADTPLEHLRRLDPGARDQDLRDWLGGFGFGGDTPLAPVAPLSGGEKARLVLALIVYDRPNLLLLDEPTNHLDLEMRHALVLALQEFEGAVVLVSHDRHLLRTVADALWLVEHGRLLRYEDDLEAYARRLARRRAEVRPAAPAPADARERRRRGAHRRQRLQPLRAEVRRLETELARLGTRRERLDAQLAEPDVYRDAGAQRRAELLRERGRVEKSLRELEAAWLEAHTRLDAALAHETAGP